MCKLSRGNQIKDQDGLLPPRCSGKALVTSLETGFHLRTLTFLANTTVQICELTFENTFLNK